MKSIIVTDIIAMTLLAVAGPVSLAAQDKAKQDHHQYHHYQLIDMGTFGGPNSSFLLPPAVRLLNNSGAEVGSADTSTPDPLCVQFNFDCYVSSAFRWQDGVVSNLGALPGSNSSLPAWVNDNGLVAGQSENGIDPLTGGYAVEAILWGKDGGLSDLGTLGGNQSYANAVNNRGQVAGAALNTIPDPYTSNVSNFYLTGATQVHAFRWTESQGMQDLGTLGSGADSAALLINKRGQIAGWSFTNTTPNPLLDDCSLFNQNLPTEDPFLWDDGKMIDLGTLGGTCGRAYSLNNRGRVAGFSYLAGDQICHPFLWDKKGGMRDLGTLGGDSGQAFSVNDAGEVVGKANLPGVLGCDQFSTPAHAFLWKNGVMTDLGTPAGDLCSFALAINAKHQVVGNGWDCNNELPPFGHSFLSEDGEPVVDLNTLIPPNSGLQLTWAADINDPGEIASLGTLSNGDIHAFMLIPCDENHPSIEGCDYSLVDAATAAQSASPRYVPSGTQRPPQSRRTNRYHVPGGLNGSDR
jgi:probable HAF family extracellular repeat protein